MRELTDLAERGAEGVTKDRSAEVVMFVVLARGIGGSTRSLATILGHLPNVHRIVASQGSGKLITLLKQRSAVDEHLTLPAPSSERLRRVSRLAAAARIAAFAWKHRRQIKCFHANGPEELNVVAPGAMLAGIPIVVWSHARDASPWMRRLAPVWRRLLPSTRWAAVSGTARQVLASAGLADPGDVEIVPNPIDPSDVVAIRREPSDRITIGYLGSDAPYKGFQLVPDVVERLQDLPVRWMLFTDQRGPENASAWTRLRSYPRDVVKVVGKLPDVSDAYARCDIVFCPSLEETFCRVAAEAMLNSLPVVASDLEPLRALLGKDDAGLRFPVGDTAAAADAVRRLVLDPGLRRAMGATGRRRAKTFEPGGIAVRLAELYGIRGRQGVERGEAP